LFRYASIDVGTNTVRLLVADAEEPASYRAVFQEQVITRLGERLQETGQLSLTPVERTLEVLQRFVQTAKDLGAKEIVAVATSAAREAKNRVEFLDRARRELGLEVQVISGEDEATLTAIGVSHALGPDQTNMMIVDIGGGEHRVHRDWTGKNNQPHQPPHGCRKTDRGAPQKRPAPRR